MFFDRLGRIDAKADIVQKYMGRISSIMIWIGFLAGLYYVIGYLIILVIIFLIGMVIFLVWFDVKYILPNKGKFLFDQNPRFREMLKNSRTE